MRLFAGDRIHGIMERFKIPDDQPMEASILSRQIEGAQKKVEEQNFVARKNVLKYDDVMNTQRMVIYEQRRSVLNGDDTSDEIREWIEDVVRQNVVLMTEADAAEDWDLDGLVVQMTALYGSDITVEELREEVDLSRESLDRGVQRGRARRLQRSRGELRARADARDRAVRDPPGRRHCAGASTSSRWTTCARACTSAPWPRRTRSSSTGARATPCSRSSARSSARRSWRRCSTSRCSRKRPQQALQPVEAPQALSYEHETSAGADVIAAAGGLASRGDGRRRRLPSQRQVVKDEERDVGRNDPCWCGSGKKFKRCHGA